MGLQNVHEVLERDGEERYQTVSAHDIRKIHSRAPFDISPTGSGAHPDNFESSDRIAHPPASRWLRA